MGLPQHSPLIPLEVYQQTLQQGTRDLVDHIHTLETAGRSTRAAQEALNSSLTILNELHDYNDAWIVQNVPASYRQGWEQAFNSSLYATPTGLGGAYNQAAFAVMHKQAIEVLAYNMRDNVDLALAQVGRQISDEFRDIAMKETLRRQFTGDTVRASTKSMVEELKGKGLTHFTDKAGRQWSLDNYCTMVARTTTREATVQGTLLRAQRMGYELIHMSEHHPTCELCAPLQGRVYTTNEEDRRYPMWFDDYCPVHPNCLHDIAVYIEKYHPDADEMRERSNRPFIDDRSPAEKQAYKDLQRKNQKLSDLRNQHSRYVSRLGADRAGTIQSFARSKAANSARYKDLQAAYRLPSSPATKVDAKVQNLLHQPLLKDRPASWGEMSRFEDELQAFTAGGSGYSETTTAILKGDANYLNKMPKLHRSDARAMLNLVDDSPIYKHPIYRLEEMGANSDLLFQKGHEFKMGLRSFSKSDSWIAKNLSGSTDMDWEAPVLLRVQQAKSINMMPYSPYFKEQQELATAGTFRVVRVTDQVISGANVKVVDIIQLAVFK